MLTGSFFLNFAPAFSFELKNQFLLQVKVSMEYPLRPPIFALNLDTTLEENGHDSDSSELFNELRAIEGEVSYTCSTLKLSAV